MITVAAYQSRPSFTFEKCKHQVLEVAEQGDREQIDFLCFPEGFLTGYYAEKELAEESALEITSPNFQSLLTQLSFFKATIIIGFNEREGDQIFDSAAIIEKGQLLGIQRKHHLYHPYFVSSDRFSVFKSKGITFGVVICLDTNYFEPSRLLAIQGASVLFVPMCNRVRLDHPLVSRPSYYSHFIARSHENRCWLVGADWVWPNDDKTFCPGHSVIYDPDGREIARSNEGSEQLVMAEIPHNRLFHEKGERVLGSPILTKEMAKLRYIASSKKELPPS